MVCDRDGAALIDVGVERTASLAIERPRSFEVDFGDDDSRIAGGAPIRENTETRDPTPSTRSPAEPLYSSQASWGLQSSRFSDRERRESEPPEMMVDRVLGSYRLLEVIGRGGMGTVYRAEHVKLGRDVALKLLRSDYAQRRDAVARFFQEARAVNRIRHRNIVDVTDFVELDGGTTFIIMELLEGESLSKLMRTPGALDATRALNILIQICDGLAAAHDVRIVHRDLKPDNVVVTRTSDSGDLVKLLDFGVAKLLQQQEEDVGLKTAAGSVIGTPAFMSPEQAGGLSVDARSDVYSLGAIMYEMFTGQPVFKARSFGEYVRRHLNDVPIPPSQTPRGGHVQPRLETIIMRCLEKSPEKRFQSARSLKFELQAVLSSVETVLEGDRTEISANPPAPAQLRAAVGAVDDIDAPTGTATQSGPLGPVASIVVEGDLLSLGGATGTATATANAGTLTQALPVSTSHGDASGDLGMYGPTPQPLASGTPFPPHPAAAGAIPAPDSLRERSGGMQFPVPHPQLTPGRFGMDTDTMAGGAPVRPTRALAHWRSPLLVAGAIAFLIAGSAVMLYGVRRGTAGRSRSVQPASETAPSGAASPSAEPAKVAEAPEAKQDAPIVNEIERPARVTVRFNSKPDKAEVFAEGATERGSLCTTPCEYTIDPADGGSPSRRDFVVKLPGYDDSVVSVNLSEPPETLDVELTKTEIKKAPPERLAAGEARAKTPKTAQGDRAEKVARTETEPRDEQPAEPKTEKQEPERAEAKAEKRERERAEAKAEKRERERAEEKKKKPKGSKTGGVNPGDTLDPFGRKGK